MTSRTRLAALLLAVLSLAACDGVTEPGERTQERVMFLRYTEPSRHFPGDSLDIYSVNADGTGLRNLTAHPAIYNHLRVSPDGRRVLFQSNRGQQWWHSYIWMMNSDGTGLKQLTTESSWNALWSPDGTRIAFEMVVDDDLLHVYVSNADGTNLTKVSGPAMQVGNTCGTSTTQSRIALVGWIGNGRIAFTRHYCGFGYRNFIVNADGSGFTQTDIPLRNAHFTPDGSQVVFTRWEGGGWRLFLMNADGTGERMLSVQGTSQGLPWGGYSAWSPDGTRIMFFAKTSGQLGNEPQSCTDSALPYVLNVDGSGAQRLMDSCIDDASFDGWSPSGEQVAFTMLSASGAPDLYVAKADGSGSVNVTNSPEWEKDAHWLPRE
jgi:TolB protein